MAHMFKMHQSVSLEYNFFIFFILFSFSSSSLRFTGLHVCPCACVHRSLMKHMSQSHTGTSNRWHTKTHTELCHAGKGWPLNGIINMHEMSETNGRKNSFSLSQILFFLFIFVGLSSDQQNILLCLLLTCCCCWPLITVVLMQLLWLFSVCNNTALYGQ